MPKVKKGKRQRAYAPKSQSGCLTCKIRRVKCDEGRPACHRCTSTSRTCDGYAHSKVPTTAVSIRASPSLDINRACPLSKRSFAYFLQLTRPQLAGFFGSDFWERLVLQAAYHEPAVRHAIIAIGSRHETAAQQTIRVGAGNMFALGQYNLAIKHLLDPSLRRGERHLDIFLMSSILFACFESIQGNHALAITHIQSGVKLLQETVYDQKTGALQHQKLGEPSRVNSYTSLETYAKVFALLDSGASRIIGDYYRSSIQSSSVHTEKIYGDSPISFSSIYEAKSTFEYGACMFSGTLDSKLSGASVQLPHSPPKDQRSHLTTLMSKFWLAVQELVRLKSSHFTEKEELAAAVLQLNVLVTWVSFEVDLQHPSSAITWDVFMPRLEEMVRLGDQIVSCIKSGNPNGAGSMSVSLESGYIIPMYAVASNCQDLTIRRRAIAVLRSVPRQEGLWNSLLAAKAAERIIEIEAEASRELAGYSGDPWEVECFRARPLLIIDAKGGRLHYTRNSLDGCDTHEVVEEIFSW
ncbi:hypothetical protein F4802DRAFT_553170 [Xylaria palmicola]|nr:hypothetical protein F4802DRAFT_553170 [Xylaria palmicola]